MDIDYYEVGRRIRSVRKRHGMTAEHLSEKIGIATESLRHIENASSKPSLPTLYRIATTLGVSMDYVTGRTPTLIDNLLIEYGLPEKQECVLREIIDSMLPIISRHI